MKNLPISLMCLALAASPALARETPKPMAYDSRVRAVVYNPDDVVQIVGTYGISTHIIFSPTETIEHVALGDTLAWEVAPIGHNLWLKPTEPDAYTNLSIVTNRRSYEFELIAKHKSEDTAGLYYMVQFTYPQDAAAAKAAQLAREHAAAHVDAVDAALKKAETPARKNIDYWVRGAAAASPDEAFDDGTFTYFRFKGNREFPAVFLETIGPDGKKTESLVNSTIKGDTIVVQRLASHFMLRKGNEVAEIVNQHYDPIGHTTGTGTIAGDVQRNVYGDKDPQPASLPTRPARSAPPAPIDYSSAGSDSVPLRPQNVLPAAPFQVFKPDADQSASQPTVPAPTANDVAAAHHMPPTRPILTAARADARPEPPADDAAPSVQPAPAPVAPQPAPKVDIPSRPHVVVSDVANLRARPTTDSPKVGLAHPGDQFEVLDSAAGRHWFKVALDGQSPAWITGWAVHYLPAGTSPAAFLSAHADGAAR